MNKDDDLIQVLLFAAIQEIGEKGNKAVKDFKESQNSSKMEPFIRNEIQRLSRKHRVKKCSFVAALAIFVVSLTFNVLVFSVAAIRGPVLDFFMGENGDYATKGTHNAIYINSEEMISPQYIPEGFTPDSVSQSKDNNMVGIEYSNNQNQYLSFTRGKTNSAGTFDTEGTETQEIVLKGKQKALCIQKGEEITLIWEIEPYNFILHSNLPVDELVVIANSVPIK